MAKNEVFECSLPAFVVGDNDDYDFMMIDGEGLLQLMAIMIMYINAQKRCREIPFYKAKFQHVTC